jgi:hypothetical protein
MAILAMIGAAFDNVISASLRFQALEATENGC